MKALYSAVLTAAITTVVVPGAFAGVSTSDAVGICKAQAAAEFSQAGVNTRVKFRRTGRKDGASEVRLQVYPAGAESFKVTCTMNRQTGEIITLARDDAPGNNLMQTAER